MDFKTRQKKLREHLATTRFDALLVGHLPNIRYLCGFTGSAGFLLVQESGSVFFTDVRYDTQARVEVKGAKVVIARKAVLNAMGEWIAARRKRARKWTIGIEADHLTVAERKRVADLLPRGLRLKSAPSLVEQARMVKDPDELERIRAAVKMGATLFDRALQVLRPGAKEAEVAAEMEYAARRAGAEGMSFPTIIASGPRSALPHTTLAIQLPRSRYSQVIVRTRPALCGWAPLLRKLAGRTMRSVTRSSRPLMRYGRESALATSTLRPVRYCVRPG